MANTLILTDAFVRACDRLRDAELEALAAAFETLEQYPWDDSVPVVSVSEATSTYALRFSDRLQVTFKRHTERPHGKPVRTLITFKTIQQD